MRSPCCPTSWPLAPTASASRPVERVLPPSSPGHPALAWGISAGGLAGWPGSCSLYLRERGALHSHLPPFRRGSGHSSWGPASLSPASGGGVGPPSALGRPPRLCPRSPAAASAPSFPQGPCGCCRQGGSRAWAPRPLPPGLPEPPGLVPSLPGASPRWLPREVGGRAGPRAPQSRFTDSSTDQGPLEDLRQETGPVSAHGQVLACPAPGGGPGDDVTRFLDHGGPSHSPPALTVPFTLD